MLKLKSAAALLQCPSPDRVKRPHLDPADVPKFIQISASLQLQIKSHAHRALQLGSNCLGMARPEGMLEAQLGHSDCQLRHPLAGLHPAHRHFPVMTDQTRADQSRQLCTWHLMNR